MRRASPNVSSQIIQSHQGTGQKTVEPWLTTQYSRPLASYLA